MVAAVSGISVKTISFTKFQCMKGSFAKKLSDLLE